MPIIAILVVMAIVRPAVSTAVGPLASIAAPVVIAEIPYGWW